MIKEIGSEFYQEKLTNKNNLDYLNLGEDYKLLMSGRTSIDYVLKNINDNIKIAYLPDYCCESIITPFIDNGYKIKYYHVFINKNNKISVNINEKEECSVFFLMNYFGYSEFNIEEYAKKFKERNTIILEDITHSLLSSKNHSIYSDYLICSLRKWFPIYTGGLAVNMNSKFTVKIDEYTTDDYLITDKKKAMKLKYDYLFEQKETKEDYLLLYKKSNDRFKLYENKCIDNESLEILKKININKIINQRVNNAKNIEKKLAQNKNINTIFKYQEGDCPLFVPIITKNRDNIQKELIKKAIYCPIHWPNYLNSDNELYDYELSLVCDHRYSEQEINEYIDALIKLVGD